MLAHCQIPYIWKFSLFVVVVNHKNENITVPYVCKRQNLSYDKHLFPRQNLSYDKHLFPRKFFTKYVQVVRPNQPLAVCSVVSNGRAVSFASERLLL